ncbi:MAG TPA: galactose-1-phosphate uridylyltransferase [Nitrososphaeraceae archaeon]|nr:galactose-1-phosphate uridylyltransferase [Nitrososphaeraceae archaeon]
MSKAEVTLGNLRKDYVLEKFVILPDSPEENIRSDSAYEKCPYCPGNESMTGPAVVSLVSKDGMLQRLSDSEGSIIEDWCVRVFQSQYPAVNTASQNNYTDKPLYSEPAYGYHQIVVASPDHRQDLSKISVEQWENVLLVIQERVRWLYTQKSVTYVSIYVDSGREAGTSYDHAHLNVVTFSTIPPIIELEAEGSHRYVNENGNCPSCNIISVELGGPRQILATDSFLAFSPWAPTYPYEFWIYPKRHTTAFSKIPQKEISDLALILRATIGGMSKGLNSPAFNLVFHLSPEKKNSRQIHWHIEVYPQTNKWSGLQRGFGIYVNAVSPESSAEVLGSACRKELAGLVGIT